MSVESQAVRAKRAVVVWRFVGGAVMIPRIFVQELANAITCILRIVNRIFQEFEMAVFVLELDAARRYQHLTGTDLGVASGNPERYAGLDPALGEKLRAERLTGYDVGEDEE